MKALVVYESHFGNTAAIARAIAEGIGSGTRTLTTSDADEAALAGIDLLVAGAPVHVFGLPSERTIEGIAEPPSGLPADVSHPPLRTWLERLPGGRAMAVAFETRVRWSPGGAGSAIESRLERAGYRIIARPGKFIVGGYYGPLRDGELDRARAWGRELARLGAAELVPAGAASPG